MCFNHLESDAHTVSELSTQVYCLICICSPSCWGRCYERPSLKALRWRTLSPPLNLVFPQLGSLTATSLKWLPKTEAFERPQNEDQGRNEGPPLGRCNTEVHLRGEAACTFTALYQYRRGWHCPAVPRRRKTAVNPTLLVKADWWFGRKLSEMQDRSGLWEWRSASHFFLETTANSSRGTLCTRFSLFAHAEGRTGDQPRNVWVQLAVLSLDTSPWSLPGSADVPVLAELPFSAQGETVWQHARNCC